MQSTAFSIIQIGLGSPLLPKLIDLYAERKARLGLFPEGAFQECASRGWILGAVDSEENVVGYLLYRVAKGRAAIVHLVVASDWIRRGVARDLVARLAKNTRHLQGISLRCRRDYNLAGMWMRFGFTVRDTKAGRGADGALLDYWWLDHNHDDLFSVASRRESETAIPAAIDANIFYDLTDDSRPHADDTRVLEADWLRDSVRLYITPELFNEIHRGTDEAAKRKARMATQAYQVLKTNTAEVESITSDLKGILLQREDVPRDESDIRQVAHAVANQIPFFLTRDRPLLTEADQIGNHFGIQIIHPVDLIVRFDALQREAHYRPASLEGSRWRIRLVTDRDVPGLVQLFKHHHERANEFETSVRHFLAQNKTWDSRIIVDETDAPVIYLAISTDGRGDSTIGDLRHTDHPLIPTLLRHVLHDLCRHSQNLTSRIIRVAEQGLTPTSTAALQETGFLPGETDWWKLSVSGVVDRARLAVLVEESPLPEDLKSGLNCENAVISQLERALNPVKIVPSGTPCFVVSIRPEWAAHFFDIPVGGQMLMDLNEQLHLGIEGAYYCSAANRHLAAPARILWYVSGSQSMEIKACSHLDEILTGGPKQLYSALRRLGVYQWKDIFRAVDGDISRPLLAFRFSRTERFSRPISRDEMNQFEIPQPQNPRRIDEQVFAEIYRLGMGALDEV
jgi:hypothetical protein